MKGHRTWFARAIGAIAALAASAPLAWAQGNSGLTGRVTDNTGGVLPGVTVVATCPCLAVPRETITGAEGRFNITTLPVGTYTVTFTLPGFANYIVRDLELSADFTATANATMGVGGVTESVTVTGASPTVDIVNVRNQQRQDMDTLEALPSGARGLSAMASLTLGATNTTAGRNDVGGALEDLNTGLSIHGSEGDQGRINFDGMNTNVMYGDGGGQQRIFKLNTIMVAETTVNAGGMGADTETGGASVNMVPRDGGNQFSLNSYFTDVTGDFSSGAVPDDIVERSGGTVTEVNNVRRVYDYAVGSGGAIVQDRVWYYGGYRRWLGQVLGVENHYNISPVWYRYEPDLDNPALTTTGQWDTGARFTIQASRKHRVSSSLNVQRGCSCDLALNITSLLAPEASTDFEYGMKTDPLVPGDDGRNGMYHWITSWTAPLTGKLLVQAGFSSLWQRVNFNDRQHQPEVGRYAVIDLAEPSKGGTFLFGAMAPAGQGGSYYRPHGNDQISQRASMSYVTGTHNFDIGFDGTQGDYDVAGGVADFPLQFILQGRRPLIIRQHAVPRNSDVRVRRYGVYAQDKWTIDRMTLNLGVRYDYHHSFALPATMDAGLPFQMQAGPGVGPITTYQPFVPEPTTYEGLDEIPKYNDITPRLGVSYDVFGTGKTAIKASWGRYVLGLGGGAGQARAPSNNIFGSVNRFWFDNAAALRLPTAGTIPGDFIPQCDFRLDSANGECGPTQGIRIADLRKVRATSQPWEANTGWGVREYSNELSVGIQHELTSGVGLNVTYFRNSWHNQQYEWNRALTADSFTRGTAAAPNDPVLEDGAGGTVQFWDINPGNQGLANEVLTRWQDIPGSGDGPKQVFNGVDVALNARFDNGALIAGGVSLGRRVDDSCWLNDLPHVSTPGNGQVFVRDSRFCAAATPLWDSLGSQAKVQFVYPLPWDLSLSGHAKTLPGIEVGANVLYSVQELTTALGRAPAGGAATRVNVMPNGTKFDDRLNQLDLRLTKALRPGGSSWVLNISAELYNVFNSRAVQGTIEDYGSRYLFPEGLLGGRFFKYVVGVDF